MALRNPPYFRQIRDPYFIMFVLKQFSIKMEIPFIHRSKQIFLFIVDCIQCRRRPFPFAHKEIRGRLLHRDTYFPMKSSLIHTLDSSRPLCSWASPNTVAHCLRDAEFADPKFEKISATPRIQDADMLIVGPVQNIIVVAKGALLRIYDYMEDQWVYTGIVPHVHTRNVSALAVHPSKPMIAVGGYDEITRLYEKIEGPARAEWGITHTFTGQEHCIHHVAFHETSGYFASAARDNNVIVYRFDDSKGWLKMYSVQYQNEVEDIMFHPSSPVLAVDTECQDKGGGTHVLNLLDSRPERTSDISPPPNTHYAAVHFHSRLPWFAVATSSGNIEIYDCGPAPWKLVSRVIPPSPLYTKKVGRWRGSIAFHPTHRLLALLWGASVSFIAPGQSGDWRCLGDIEIPACVMFCTRLNSMICFHRALPLLFISHQKQEPVSENQSVLNGDTTVVYNTDRLPMFR